MKQISKIISILIFLIVQPQINSQNLEEIFSLGINAAQYGNLDSSLTYFSQIIKKDNKFLSAYFQRSLIYWQIGEFEKALTDLNKCIALDKNFPDAFLFRARINKEIGDLDKAFVDYNFALQNEPENVDALYERAQVNFIRDRWTDAIYDLDFIIKLNPNNLDALTQKALILDAMKKSDEAEDILSKVINLNSEDKHSSYYNRGLVRSKMDSIGSRKLAEEDFTAAIRLSNDFVAAYIERGKLRIQSESRLTKIEGINDFITSVKLDKTSYNEVWEYISSARKSLNDYSGLTTDIEEILRNYPNDWEILFFNGRAKQEFSHFLESILDFELVIKLIPEFPFSHYWMGVSYYNIHQYSEAKNSFLICRDKLPEINQLDSSFFHSLYYLITNCNKELLEFEEAVFHMDDALKLFPTSAGLLSNKAYYLNLSGKFNEALITIEKGLRYDSNLPQLYKNRAFANFKLGKITRAFEDINRAITLNILLAEAYYYRALFNFEIDLSQKNKICEDIIKAKELGYLDLDPKLEKFCQ